MKTKTAFNNQLHQTPEGSLLDMKYHGGAGIVIILLWYTIIRFITEWFVRKYIFPYHLKKAQIGDKIYCVYCKRKIELVNKDECPKCDEPYK